MPAQSSLVTSGIRNHMKHCFHDDGHEEEAGPGPTTQQARGGKVSNLDPQVCRYALAKFIDADLSIS